MDTMIPVFLFTGFLESGKTLFLKDTINDPQFTENQRILVVACEEGIEEYDIAGLEKKNIFVEMIDDISDFNPNKLADFAKKYSPKKVLIEYNGMWQLEPMLTMKLPKSWGIAQIITTVAAPTYELYLNNMRSLMMEQFTNTDMVVFNRCDANSKIGNYRRAVKAVNPAAQVYFENADGSAPNMDDALPYDINSDVIELNDDDFGIWFVDARETPSKYEGKTIITTAQVYKSLKLAQGTFIPGRMTMTCCADDVSFFGPLCKSLISTDSQIRQLKKGQWIKLTAKIVSEDSKYYKGEGPVLYATNIEPAAKPANEIVYLY